MKRLILFAALGFSAISGCTCLDLAAQRAYACDLDAGEGQCPGDGVCGLEGFCHARGDEQPWQCTSDSHCEGDWRCGLEGVCHQIGDEQPWKCTEDTHCEGDWRCGLEGTCHAIGDEQQWLCHDDTHCEGDWRCGPEGRCLDPAGEALLPAGATQLTANRVPQKLPAALPTAMSSGGYHGSYFFQSCSDHPAEVDGGNLYVWEYVQSASVFTDGGYFRMMEWNQRWVLPDGGFPTALDCDGGSGATVSQLQLEIFERPAPPGVLAAFDHERTTWALLDGGTLCRFDLDDSLQLSEDCGASFSATSPPTTLRGSYPPGRYLIGLGADHFQIFDAEAQTFGEVSHVYSGDGGILPIHDLIAYGYTPTYLLAATPVGGMAKSIDGYVIGDGGIIHTDGWQPVSLGNNAGRCEPERYGDYERYPLRFALSTSEGSGLSLQVLHRGRSWDGETFNDQLSVLRSAQDDGGWWYGGSCQSLPSLEWQGYFVEDTRTCDVCPEGSRTLWFHAREEPAFEDDSVFGVGDIEDPIKLEVRCENPDGGRQLVGLDPSGACRPWDQGSDSPVNTSPDTLRGARYERPVVADPVSVFGTTVADDRGHFWRSEQYDWELIPWFLDRAPAFAFDGFMDKLTVTTPVETYGRLFDVPVVLLPPLSFDETAGGYLPSEFGEVPVVATIARQPSFIMVNFNPPGADPIIGLFEILEPGARPGDSPVRAHARLPTESVFGPPYHADIASTSDGKEILVISTFDTVLAADITDSVNAPPPTDPFSFQEFFDAVEPQVKFSAVLRTPVQSLVTLAAKSDADGGSGEVEGYVLQASRVFRFRAPNFNVWRTEEIVLEDETEPLAVFADGVRGRVGMKNGRVYSLPTRFALAEELPANAQPATAFHSWCGHVVAVARDGVYRLAQTSAAVATWERLPLPSRGYAGTFVHGRPDALRVFTTTGEGYRITGFECRAPAE